MNSPLNVYLIDDDPAILTAMSRALGKRGYEVETFASAAAFLQNYQPSDTGCIVLDLSMPNMTGLELQQELIARNIRLPIIFITGHGSVPESVKALKAGAVDFLEKPFRQERLVEAIEEAFETEKTRRVSESATVDIRNSYSTLTARENQIMSLILSKSGSISSKEIARQLDISHRTVDHHRARIMSKMQADSVAALVAIGLKLGV